MNHINSLLDLWLSVVTSRCVAPTGAWREGRVSEIKVFYPPGFIPEKLLQANVSQSKVKPKITAPLKVAGPFPLESQETFSARRDQCRDGMFLPWLTLCYFTRSRGCLPFELPPPVQPSLCTSVPLHVSLNVQSLPSWVPNWHSIRG